MSFVFREKFINEDARTSIFHIIGGKYLKMLDPFLMFNYSKFKLPSGFPDHPHRGFESITYMKQGKLYHEDFNGHKGIVGPGDARWVHAGRGLVHAQMPGSAQDFSIGFQLWKNVRMEDKLQQPKYKDIKNEQIPFFEKNGTIVKIISGTLLGKSGPLRTQTPSSFFDIEISKNGAFDTVIQAKWNSLIFVYEGKLTYFCQNNEQTVNELECCVFSKSSEKDLYHKFTSEDGAKLILLSGQPINEPVCSNWKFAVSSAQQMKQANEDYQLCKNGFENRKNWESQIGYLLVNKFEG